MNKLSDYKEDSRSQKYGWAPGNYMQSCCICKDPFIGDKRAVMCADCAYSKDVAVFIGEVEEIFYCPVCDSVLTFGTLDEEEYLECFLNCPVCDFDIIGSGDTAEEAMKFLMEEYKYYKEEEML